MPAYTVRQLARMAGVSVRTLHHYDQIGLLKPSSRTAAGYRQYEEGELLRLQQILFFRELDLPLDEIRRILDDPEFDEIEALDRHRRILTERSRRLARLLTTIDRTIMRLLEDKMVPQMTDEELYEGFTKEQAERYRREARETYDPALVQESEKRLKKMPKERWAAIKQEGDDITRQIAELMDRQPDDPDVQAHVRRHHAWIERFYPCSADVYRGLGKLYTENDEFRATYDRYAQGLADYMRAAMTYFADHSLPD